MSDLTHLDENGAARMVDITDKEISQRQAIATSCISMLPETLDKVLNDGIKKGDELEVEEQGTNILVSTDNKGVFTEIEVDVSKMDRDSLMFLIRALYKNGYDEIRLKFNTDYVPHIRINKKVKTFDVISKEISRLPGMDIFSHKENYCIIH